MISVDDYAERFLHLDLEDIMIRTALKCDTHRLESNRWRAKLNAIGIRNTAKINTAQLYLIKFEMDDESFIAAVEQPA